MAFSFWALALFLSSNAYPDRYIRTSRPPNKCLSITDLKSAVCYALCKRDGYDTGKYLIDKCLCGAFKDFSTFIEDKIYILPPVEGKLD